MLYSITTRLTLAIRTVKDDIQSAPGQSGGNSSEQGNCGIMQNAVTLKPTEASDDTGFAAVPAKSTYALTLKNFDASTHSAQLSLSYKKSDIVKRLCNGKMCVGSPLIVRVAPDRREQKKLLNTFSELMPQPFADVVYPFAKAQISNKLKSHPIGKWVTNTLTHYGLHSFEQKGVRNIYHRLGCVVKGCPCPGKSSVIPNDYLQPPLMATAKPKDNIDAKVEWNELDFRTLNADNMKEFEENVPMKKLEDLYKSMMFELYDSEKDRLGNIKPTQPQWVHPNWTEKFENIITDFILQNPTSREAVERWLVGKIKGKMLLKTWHTSKRNEIIKYLKKNKETVLRNLRWIKQCPNWGKGDWPIGSDTFVRKLTEFAKKLRLDVSDVYEIDVRKYVEKHYKDVNVELLDFVSDSSSESESESKEEIDYSPLRDEFQPTNVLEYKSESL